MPIVNCDVKLVGRFHCDTPESAGPGGRKQSQMGALYDAGKAHCAITLRFGTSGTFLQRQDINYYKGHVPDAPPMLGAQQTEIYNDAVCLASSSLQRGKAMLGAMAAGACAGALIGCCVVGFVSLAHAVTGALLFRVTLGTFQLGAAVGAAAFAVVKMAMDWNAYVKAAAQFEQLYILSVLGERASKSIQLVSEKAALDMRQFADRAIQSTSWPIRHAGLELLATMRESKHPEVRCA